MKNLVISVVAASLLTVTAVFNPVLAWHGGIPPEIWYGLKMEGAPTNVSLFEMYALIRVAYYKEIDVHECFEKIIEKGLGECLDKNSRVIKSRDVAEVQEEREGKFGGVGMEMTERNKKIVIVSVVENSPAFFAGVKAGDVLVSLNEGDKEKDVSIMDVFETTKNIRGKVGTSLTITVLRNGEKKIFNLTRAVIKVVFVKSTLLYPDIAYVRIKQFQGPDTVHDFIAALEEFRAHGKKNLIIDVRNNPGGLLWWAEAMLILFAENPDSILVTSVMRQGEQIERVKDVPELLNGAYTDEEGNPQRPLDKSHIGRFKDLKVVVLVNEFSASAAEIFAGTIKDWAKAREKDRGQEENPWGDRVVIGEKSFGKGTVQAEYNLANGGIFHLTVAEYFLGDKKVKVDGVGIMPDYEVKNYDIYSSSAEILREDRQLSKAMELLRNQ